jgi:sugar-specific transcriptional regulator TrmB
MSRNQVVLYNKLRAYLEAVKTYEGVKYDDFVNIDHYYSHCSRKGGGKRSAFCDTIDEAVGIFTNPEMSNNLDNMIKDAEKRAEIFKTKQGVRGNIHLIEDRYEEINTFELGSAMLPTQDRWTNYFKPEKLDGAREKLMKTVNDVIQKKNKLEGIVNRARTELSNLGENSEAINTLLEEALRGVENSRTAAIKRIQDFMGEDFEKRKPIVDEHYGNNDVTEKIKKELNTILNLLQNN